MKELSLMFRELWYEPARRALQYVGAIGFGLKHQKLNPTGRYPALWTRFAVGRRVFRIKLCWAALRCVPSACFYRLLGKLGVFCIQQVIKSIGVRERVIFEFFHSGDESHVVVTSNYK